MRPIALNARINRGGYAQGYAQPSRRGYARGYAQPTPPGRELDPGRARDPPVDGPSGRGWSKTMVFHRIWAPAGPKPYVFIGLARGHMSQTCSAFGLEAFNHLFRRGRTFFGR